MPTILRLFPLLFTLLPVFVNGAPCLDDSSAGDKRPSLPRQLAPTVSTNNGKVQGTMLSRGVNRFTFPYAQPPIGSLRFADPIAVTSWTIPFDGSELQSACPQQGGPNPSVNEDCLYMNVFAPSWAIPQSRLPVLVWLHGGSRSATDTGLDGSNLVKKGNILFVTIEYRQGALGNLRQPSLSATGSQGLKDIIAALQSIQTNVAAFGGDPAQITLAGQSTGASLIATLLATPSADRLFSKAILQSAPLNYGDLSISTAENFGKVFLSQLDCADQACLQSVNVSAILEAETNAIYAATDAGSPGYVEGIASAQAFRPTVDGNLIKGNLMNHDTDMTRKDRSFILSTVQDEAGPQISMVSASVSSNGQPAPISEDYYDYLVGALLTPQSRSDAVLNSNLYPLNTNDSDTTRDELSLMGSDYVWKCPVQQAAVAVSQYKYAKSVFLASFEMGLTYPTNSDIEFCEGKVCHEDDIFVALGNAQSPLSTTQQALQNEVTTRWLNFVKSGNPNAASYPQWNPVNSANNLNVINFGRLKNANFAGASLSVIEQTQRAAECGSNGLWGSRVKFDVNFYESQ